MAVISVEQVTYTYPHTKQPALQELSFEVAAGDFVAVIGPNGAGKSTLCYALTGFVPHFFRGQMSGRVEVAELETGVHDLEDIVLKAGLVFQNPKNQISGAKFTVYEELAFGLENLGLTREAMRERIERAMTLSGISDLAERSPYGLSGGQQQRVALASMLVMEPEILVLDEPTSQLDPIGSREVFSVVRELSREQGLTVVMAGHKLEWIATFATRVLVLVEGRLVLDGPPDEVLVSPLLQEHFIGQTRYTTLARQAQQDGLWPEQPLPVTLDEAEAGFRAVLGVRQPD